MADTSTSNIRKMDGALLLVFRELLRTRNATQAAKHLHVSQSAVSHSLTRLRNIFGDPLFVRRPHGLQPTRQALQLGPRVDALLELAAETMRGEGSFTPVESDRRFKLVAPEFVTAHVGAPLINSLKKHAPKVSIAVQFLQQEQAMDALGHGEIDLALGRFGTLRRAGLCSERLYEDHYCVVARRRHSYLKGKITLVEYSRVGHIFVGSHGEGGPNEVLPDPRLVTTTSVVPHWLTALVLVSATDAITTCPRRLAERQAEVLDLQLIEAPFETKPFVVSAVRRSEARDVGVEWFMDQVRAAVL